GSSLRSCASRSDKSGLPYIPGAGSLNASLLGSGATAGWQRISRPPSPQQPHSSTLLRSCSSHDDSLVRFKIRVGLTWGMSCQAVSVTSLRLPLLGIRGSSPFQYAANDDRIYSHSVGHNGPHHDPSFSRTSGSGRVGPFSLRRHISAPSDYDRHPPGSGGSVR